MSVPVFVEGASKQGAPTTSLTVSAASWRGTSMIQKAFTTLKSASFQGRGNGRFSLNDGRGPRIGASRGVIDTEFRMGSGASTVVLVQSAYSSTTAPLITIGVNSSGQAVGSIQDINGTTVAAWAATTMGTISRTVNVRMQVAWNSSSEIEGGLHVWVIVNGVLMPAAAFTTAPTSNWTPFQALYVTTGLYCETGFDGEMLFTQASATAPTITVPPVHILAMDIGSSTLSMPLPAPALTGALTMTTTLTGTLTLPSLQLSGSLTVDVNKVTAWLRLATATTVSGDFSSVPDLFASNPAVQTVAAQRPTLVTSANSLPTASFVLADPNELSWPVSANNNSTQKWGFACWIKMATYPAQAYLFDFGGATSRYDNERVNLFFNSSRTIFFEVFGQDTSGYNGRIGQAQFQSPVSGTWFFLRVQFDGTQATEALRIKIFINEVLATMTYSNNGSGGNPVLLRTNAENIPGIIGNFTNTTDTSLALNGTVGPNIFIFNDSPTVAQGAAIMAFEQPT